MAPKRGCLRGLLKSQKFLTIVILLIFALLIWLSISSINQMTSTGQKFLRSNTPASAVVPHESRVEAVLSPPMRNRKAIRHEEHAIAPAESSVPNLIPKQPVDPLVSLAADAYDTVLLVVASSNRPDYLRKTLEHVVKYHPRNSIPVLVSEDGNSMAVNEVVEEIRRSFMKQTHPAIPLVHVHNPSAREPAENGYFALSRHFSWALNKAFDDNWILPNAATSARRVIILEEDLQIAPDFFNYFMALAPMLDQDESLLTISAWNDNGLHKFVADEKQLFRSDFFPGLGWMMTRKLWTELGPKWPRAYWDDWLREPSQRKGRHTIRPEVCRTFHFGKKGVSNQQFHEFTDDIKLNEIPVDFSTMDFAYLKKDTWDADYLHRVKQALLVTPDTLRMGTFPLYSEVRVHYDSLDQGPKSFAALARKLGIMDNIKANVPRTAYRGIVTYRSNGGTLTVHVAPAALMMTL